MITTVKNTVRWTYVMEDFKSETVGTFYKKRIEVKSHQV